jgi:uncharacterized membrane protein YfcA
MVPAAAAGAARQHSYGNLRAKAAVTLGVASIGGAELGVRIATNVGEAQIRRAFGVVHLVVAGQLAFRGARNRTM